MHHVSYSSNFIRKKERKKERKVVNHEKISGEKI